MTKTDVKIAPVSLIGTKGLCPKRKCLKKANHEGKCWPST